MKSNELYRRSVKVAPGGVHSPVRAFKSVGGEPLFFESSKGAHITSVEGKSYIDFCMSFGPNILGHRDEEISEVVREVSEKAWSLGTCEPYSLELSEWMREELPFLDKFRFVCSGTEAVMSALRVARGATGRSKVLKFNGCYHGHADGMLVKSGSGLAGLATSDSAGVSEQVAAETIVCELDDENSVTEMFERFGSDIAAVIMEPLPANYGLLIQRKEFLLHVVETARKHGAKLVFDEVISGFRIGMTGMAGFLGVEPDLVTYGKVMGGGFPVGCYAGKEECMNQVAPQGPVYQAGTLAANPIGMAAGLATLKKLKRDNVHGVLAEKAESFIGELNSRFKDKGIPMNAAHQQSLFWLHKATDEPIRHLSGFASDHAEGYQGLFHGCLKRGIYLAPSAYEVGFLSTAHTDDLLEQALDAMVASCEESMG